MPSVMARKPRARRQTADIRGESDQPHSGPVPADSVNPHDLALVRRSLDSIDWAFGDDDTGYLAHDIHPYPAKFIPQIPAHLIAVLSHRGDLVFDPFGGSGTTALEAVRLGRRALCADANPVGLLVGRVKTTPITIAARTELHAIKSSIRSAITDLPSTAILLDTYGRFIPAIPNRTKWFPDASSAELALIRDRIARLKTAAASDIAALALSRIDLPPRFSPVTELV